ncbi:hypothetical protein OG828_40660 [Streptomyces sp. NBC_00457]|nr:MULTISPECIES: hypothetical protein [unclassified Streptomyces]
MLLGVAREGGFLVLDVRGGRTTAALFVDRPRPVVREPGNS